MGEEADRPVVKPWMVAAVLAVVGITGAVAVTCTAKAIHSIDRRDVEGWEAFLLPRMTVVRAEQAEIERLAARASDGDTEAELDRDLRRVRRRLQVLRRPLHEHDYERITIPATGHYLSAYGLVLDALATLENALTAREWPLHRARFDETLRKADAAYAEGERLRDRLRARAGLPPA